MSGALKYNAAHAGFHEHTGNVEVKVYPPDADVDAFLVLVHRAGAMGFQFRMTPEQARELGSSLFNAAHIMEGIAP